MRSNTVTINGITAYELNITESNSLVEIKIGSTPLDTPQTCYYGVKIAKISSNGTKTYITSNVVAIVSLDSGATATYTLSANWTSTETSLDSLDAVLVELYADVAVSPPVTLRRSWITEPLNAVKLDGGVAWTFYYRVRRQQTRIYDEEYGWGYIWSFSFRHGISTDSSYINNFSYSFQTPTYKPQVYPFNYMIPFWFFAGFIFILSYAGNIRKVKKV